MRRLGVAGLVVGLCGAGLPAVACGDKFQGDGDDRTSGGTGGAAGANDTGGSSTNGGTAQGGVTPGGADSGGTTATGGAETGGASTGGTESGGASTGGTESGGASTGGATSGGATSGGATSGGATSGGATSGGATSGGATSGGATSGGATSGGATSGGATSGGAGGATSGGATSGGAGGATSGGAGGATSGGRAGATSGVGGVGGGGGGGGLGGGGNEPVSTDHLVYWFSADVGVVQSGNVVSRWSDRSPNGSHAAQLANATRPVLATLGRTPLPAILFDGVDDYLGLPPLNVSFTQGVTFFAVARAVASPTCMSMLQLSNGSEIDDLSFDWYEGAFLYEVFNQYLIGQDDAFGVGESRLLGARETTDGNVTMWVNGLSTGVAQFELPVTVVRNQTFIGRSLYAGCSTFGGEIAEIILYARVLPEDERRTVEAYLQNKWLCCGS